MEQTILEPESADVELLTPPLTFSWHKPEIILTNEGSVSDARQTLDMRMHVSGTCHGSDVAETLRLQTEENAEHLAELLSSIPDDSLPLLTVYSQGSPYLLSGIPKKDQAFIEYCLRLYKPGADTNRQKRIHAAIVEHRETVQLQQRKTPDFTAIYSQGLRTVISKLLKKNASL